MRPIAGAHPSKTPGLTSRSVLPMLAAHLTRSPRNRAELLDLIWVVRMAR
jgi:hypothetical protein